MSSIRLKILEREWRPEKKGYANEINTWMKFFVECYARFVLHPPKFNVTCSKKGLTLKNKYGILDERERTKINYRLK